MKSLKLSFKAILTIIISTTFSQISIAQVKEKHVYDMSERKSITEDNVRHIADKNGDKFVGTWIWRQNNTLLKITLKKYTHNWGGDKEQASIDLLTGTCSFVKNGKEIINSDGKEAITGSTEGQPSIAYLSIYNPKTPKNIAYLATSDEYILTYINNNSVKLELSKRRREGSPNKNNLSLPVDIILTRDN